MGVSWSKAIRWLGLCGLLLASIDVVRGQNVARSVRPAVREEAEEMEEPAAIPEWSPTRDRSSGSRSEAARPAPRSGSTARPVASAKPAAKGAVAAPAPAAAPPAGRAAAGKTAASKTSASTAAAKPAPRQTVNHEDDGTFRLTEYFSGGTTVRRAPQRVAARSSRQIQIPDGAEIVDEGTYVDGEPWSDGGVVQGSGGCSSCGGGGGGSCSSCGDCGDCGDCCEDDCGSCFRGRFCRRGLLRRPLLDNCCGGDGCMDGCDECSPWIEENVCDDCRRWWRRGRCRRCTDWCLFDDLSLNVGMAGFKGPADLGVNGNFGFSYGVNWGAPFWDRFGIGMQLGYRGVSSNLSGDPISGAGSSRQQNFVTAGLFRRFSNENLGYWQSGVAYDALSDDYYTNYSLSQVRVELSHFIDEFNEIGFLGAFRSQGDTGTLAGVPINFQAQSQYTGFYRRQLNRGAQIRFWGGATDNSDGLVGFDYSSPIASFWSVQASGNYLIPNEGATVAGQANEAWGLGFNLVWHPLRNAVQAARSPYRPLFNVADNSSFLTEIAP